MLTASQPSPPRSSSVCTAADFPRVAVGASWFENKVSQVALGGKARVAIDATRISRANQPEWERDFIKLAPLRRIPYHSLRVAQGNDLYQIEDAAP